MYIIVSTDLTGDDMTQTEIIEEFKKLPPDQRIGAIEVILRSLRDEFRGRNSIKEKMARAAKKLLPDYSAGGELTSVVSHISPDL